MGKKDLSPLSWNVVEVLQRSRNERKNKIGQDQQ